MRRSQPDQQILRAFFALVATISISAVLLIALVAGVLTAATAGREDIEDYHLATFIFVLEFIKQFIISLKNKNKKLLCILKTDPKNEFL